MLEVDQPEPIASLAPSTNPPNPLPSGIQWSDTQKAHIHIRSGRPVDYSRGHTWNYSDTTGGSVVLPPTPTSPLASTLRQSILSQPTLTPIQEELHSELPSLPQYSLPPPPPPAPTPMSSQTMTLTDDKGLGVQTPTPFNGCREHLNNFVRECTFYLWRNKKKFTTERMKVIFALSYMKDGTAEHWRNMCIQDMIDNK